MKKYICFTFLILQMSVVVLSQSARNEKVPSLYWSFQMPFQNCSNAVLNMDLVFVNCYDKLLNKAFQYAINKKTGNIIWQNNIPEQLSEPNTDELSAYYGSKNNKIIALNKKSGKEIWRFDKIKGPVCSAPAISGNLLFFGTHEKEWCVVDARNGKVIETKIMQSGLCCSPSSNEKYVFFTDWEGKLHRQQISNLTDSLIYQTFASSHVSPLVIGKIGIMTNDKNMVIAVNLENGKEIWKFETDGKLWRSPAAENNICIVVTDNSHLYAINIDTGKLIWDAKKEGTIYTSPNIRGGVAYVGCGDKNIYAFDIYTGLQMWKLQLDQNAEKIAIENNIMYFTSGNNVFAYKL